MPDGLLELASASPWAYALVLAAAALDAVFPVVPSETTGISAGVLAGLGDLSIALVIAAGAAGALAGDSGGYALGRGFGPRLERRVSRKRRAWAEDMLARRGGSILLIARFVPGGRTAATLTAGAVGMRRRRFLGFAAVAAVLWASFAALVGYVGGRSFQDDPHLAFALAFALSLGMFAVLEAGRCLRLGGGSAIPPIRRRGGDDRLPA
jgi:membrane-associated protein